MEDESYYWDQWINEKDPEAANVLIKLYEPIIHFQVKRVRMNVPKSVTTDELMSYAYVGLYDALMKFDHGRDLKFDTYASIRVKGAIIDGLRRDDPLPRSLRAKTKKFDKVVEELEQRLGRVVTVEDIAREMGMETNEVRSVLNEAQAGISMSLDESLDVPHGNESIGSIIEDKNSINPMELLMKTESVERLSEEIAKLSEKEQYVISLFYQEELTLSEIGRILGLSTSRISQIHSKVLKKLKCRPHVLFVIQK